MTHQHRACWIAVLSQSDTPDDANIFRAQSLDPEALQAHKALYRHIMFGLSQL